MMKSSTLLKDLVDSQKIKILTVYPDDDISLWRERLSELSPNWINAYDKGQVLTYKSLYDLSSIPSFYLLNKDKKVLLKDVLFELREFANEDGTTSKLYGIGFEVTDATLGNKLGYTWNCALDYVRMVRLSLGMLVRGDAGINDMAGPVGIVKQMSETADASQNMLEAVYRLLDFGGLIAINLAVMNLLPIPALDGGRAVCLLLTTAVEGITKKKLNPKYEGYLHGVGMILLLGFMAIITLKDIFGLFK